MANPKRTVYVGALAEEVDEKILHAAFIPFGKRQREEISKRIRGVFFSR